MYRIRLAAVLLLGLALMVGCGGDQQPAGGGGGGGGGGGASASESTPAFSLAWSEYPSWSVFGVAHEMGLLDGEEGKLGDVEQKWGVDVVLKEASYDSCLNMFTSKNCDAVCMTNMDALIVSPNRDGVAVLPTSTSNGADACIVVGINNLDELKLHKVYGLKGTVSEYCFVRGIEEFEKEESKGHKAADFQFTNQDPGAAAVAMAQKQDSHKAIMVWNPFVLQTLKDRPDAKVLFDSSKIPGEIVDMVVVGRDVLEREGADKFLSAVLDTFYQMNEALADPDTGDKALVALGEKFSNLGLEEMKKVVQQTQFYKTADDGIALLESEEFKTTMKTVEKFCVDQGLVSAPQYGFGQDSGVKLLFDASFISSFESKLMMMIRQPIPRPWRIGLGIASVVLLLLAYTLLAQSRQSTRRLEQREIAQEKLAELQEESEERGERRAALFREAKEIEDETQRAETLERLRAEEEAFRQEMNRWSGLAENPDATDMTVPTWSLLLRNGLIRSCTPQGSFERKEIWILSDFKATLLRLVTALLLGIAASVLLGLMMGCADAVDAFFMPPFAFFSKVPATAVLPIFFVLVQINFKMYLVIIAFGILPTLAQSISQSVRKDVPEELIYKAYTLGASQVELIWEVIYKQVLPRILDAARLQIGPALVLLVAAEWMVAGEGIGYRLRLFYQRTDMTVVFVYVFILGLMGWATDYLLIWSRRRLCPWFGD